MSLEPPVSVSISTTTYDLVPESANNQELPVTTTQTGKELNASTGDNEENAANGSESEGDNQETSNDEEDAEEEEFLKNLERSTEEPQKGKRHMTAAERKRFYMDKRLGGRCDETVGRGFKGHVSEKGIRYPVRAVSNTPLEDGSLGVGLVYPFVHVTKMENYHAKNNKELPLMTLEELRMKYKVVRQDEDLVRETEKFIMQRRREDEGGQPKHRFYKCPYCGVSIGKGRIDSILRHMFPSGYTPCFRKKAIPGKGYLGCRVRLMKDLPDIEPIRVTWEELLEGPKAKRGRQSQCVQTE